MSASTTFSKRQVKKLAGLSRSTLDAFVSSGIVEPVGDRFVLRDVTVLRAAKALRNARVPTRRVVQALIRTRSGLPNQHLASVRLRANGNAVEFADHDGWVDALTGQRALELQTAEGVSPALPINAAAQQSAHDWYEEAARLESSDAAAAEAAYRSALHLDPSFADASIDLSALLCRAARFADALHALDAALLAGQESTLLQFNRAVALEGLERPLLATAAYQRVLELDPSHVEAHGNLAVLAEKLGERQAAVRHYSAYRRLSQHR